MESKTTVEVQVGLGIKGDRYASGMGAFSDQQPPKIRHISIIASTGIAIANLWLEADNEAPFTDAQTRRNVVLDGISPSELNALVGETFQLGGISLKGTELCAPCIRPGELLGKSNFMDAFDGRGGIRAEILSSGTLSSGDALFISNQKSND
ncbi:MOSC domain-containing protein [Polynucleobacter sp.]|uniref:MOSC domain-containing protein n=1 Tax=Polynucleobacter sp. TaxID=2029855 RepID=UPI00301A92FE